MKNKIGFLFVVCLLAYSPFAQSCTVDGQEGFFPKNDVRIPLTGMHSFSIEKDVFMKAIDKANALYAPVFKAQGRTLEIVKDWDNAQANAFAKRSGKTSIVHMFGGLARHPKVTADGFMLVICHEIGHHLGGAVKNPGLFGKSWASNEGQSDLFATLKCAREVWKDEDNVAIVSQMNVPARAVEFCKKSFADLNEQALCMRSAMGGKSLADTLLALNKKEGETLFEKPDPAVVKSTFNKHPEAQCRLDTYFAGSLCVRKKEEALSDTDPTVGTCSTEKGDNVGTRPLCWYKPGKAAAGTWPNVLGVDESVYY